VSYTTTRECYWQTRYFVLLLLYIIFNTDADLTMTECRNVQTLGADLITHGYIHFVYIKGSIEMFRLKLEILLICTRE
jgi:hypothetical protein